MVLRTTIWCAGVLLLAMSIPAQHAQAQAAMPKRDAAAQENVFEETHPLGSPTSPSDARRSLPTTAELRQQRGMYQSRQRIARLEAAAWLNDTSLRPNWNAIPMMSSRYSSRRVIYIPVYVRD